MEILTLELKWKMAIYASCLQGSADSVTNETYYSMDYMTSMKEKQNVIWRHLDDPIWYAKAASYLQQKEKYVVQIFVSLT